MRYNKLQANQERGAWRHYAFAAATVVAFALGQKLLFPQLYGASALPVLVLSVMIAAFRWGGGPSLLASCLSIPIAAYSFLNPEMSFTIASRGDAVLLLFIALLCLLTSAMSTLLHNWRRKASALTATLEEREQTVRALLDSAPLAIFGIDASDRIRFTNKAVTDVFGFHPDELIGKPSDMLIDASAEPDGELSKNSGFAYY
jgi:K+-sensing histidine kinase KdpD